MQGFYIALPVLCDMDKRVRPFFPAAGVWFAIGATIGLLMGVWPSRFIYLRPAHVAINTMGWMSMLMYGMTYLVMPIFIRRSFYRPVLITVHWAVANLSIASFFLSHLLAIPVLDTVGWMGQTAAALLFLLNILQASFRGARITGPQALADSLALPKVEPGRLARLDRSGRSFTEASVLYLTIGALWMVATRLGWISGEAAAAFLIRYGWMAMLAYGTSYHMLPRLFGRLPGAGANYLVRPQLLLIHLGVLSAFVGMQSDLGWLWRTGVGLIALSAALHVAVTASILMAPPTADSLVGSRPTARWYFWGSDTALLLAGVIGLLWVVSGSDAPYEWFLSLTHLFLLGWMTLLAYGVGGLMLPLAVGHKLAVGWLYGIQAWLALPGSLLMAFGLLLRGSVAGTESLFAVGASLCAASAVLFGLNILLTVAPGLRRQSRPEGPSARA